VHGGLGHGNGHAAVAATDRCDLRWHELAALLPLAVFVVWIGLTPATFLAPAAPALRATTRAAANAFAARMQAATPSDQVAHAP
jgi:NADH:ubiquinone oxidoreductase subunit 4 (subunit M)